MPTLTVGTNTYVTLAEAETYFDDHYGYDLWIDSLVDNTKEQLLLSACAHLDLMCTWDGDLSDEDQVLAFPRDDESTPDSVKVAQFEIAYMMLTTGSTVSDSGDPVSEITAGSVTLKFKAGSKINPFKTDYVIDLLSEYGLCSGNGAKMISIARA